MSFRSSAKEAKKSSFKQHRLGAVIVKGGRILSTGFNQLRYTKELKRPTLHAEEDAILKLLKERRLHDLSGAEIFVTRFTKAGATGMARPCDTCMALIRSVGIHTMHFTTDGNTISEKV